MRRSGTRRRGRSRTRPKRCWCRGGTGRRSSRCEENERARERESATPLCESVLCVAVRVSGCSTHRYRHTNIGHCCGRLDQCLCMALPLPLLLPSMPYLLSSARSLKIIFATSTSNTDCHDGLYFLVHASASFHVSARPSPRLSPRLSPYLSPSPPVSVSPRRASVRPRLKVSSMPSKGTGHPLHWTR